MVAYFENRGATIRWEKIEREDAGYCPPDTFVEQMAKAKSRMAAWEAGDWCFVGVIARAHVSIPVGDGSFVEYSFDSPGIWGVEGDDDSAEYRDELFREEQAELSAHMAVTGALFSGHDE